MNFSELNAKLAERAPDFRDASSSNQSVNVLFRDAYKVDLGRVIHSASFRRLQAKTQVMGTGEGDFHRTRLTHSIEVGQISRGILWNLQEMADEAYQEYLPSSELIEAISYCHDLGHPPFGHGGEVALQKLMWNHGGFEGNAQTLRIITKLEKIYEYDGIKPTRRLLLGILKYPIKYSRYDSNTHKIKPPKCYYDLEDEIVQRALSVFQTTDVNLFTSLGSDGKPCFKTLDCSIMDLADDIAYGVHDLEDGIRRKIIRREIAMPVLEDILEEAGTDRFGTLSKGKILDYLFSTKANERKLAISLLVNTFVQSTSLINRGCFSSPLFDLSVQVPGHIRHLLDRLSKDVIRKFIIDKPELKTLERKGERIISDIFNTLVEDPVGLIGHSELSQLSCDLKDLTKGKEATPVNDRKLIRGISDFISSMTDTGAMQYHRRLFEPGFGNSVDEI